ncbi:hypothetical protein CC78DRAFT_533970 [Lojkania enalia]|uniref:Uncharacterized protein n=1 Tax=Lojkania enalia TaxID=147567 RepID=A0A9P4K874_9PLEO|nr:hypothetical protein CC78DRAFT_533970 [Didymosphaeria enalia]
MPPRASLSGYPEQSIAVARMAGVLGRNLSNRSNERWPPTATALRPGGYPISNCAPPKTAIFL